MFEGYIPPTEYGRHLLQEKRRARAAGRTALMKMGARFGTEPDPAPGQYYDLSDEDRSAIEQVIADNQSPDLLRQKEAYNWWSAALDYAAGPIWWTNITTAILEGGSVVLDLLGRQVLETFDFPAGALLFGDSGDTGAALTDLTVGAGDEFGFADVSWAVAFTVHDWTCTNNADVGFGEFSQYGNVDVRIEFRNASTTGLLLALTSSGGPIRVAEHQAPECIFPGYNVVDPSTGLPQNWISQDSGSFQVPEEACIMATVNVGAAGSEPIAQLPQPICHDGSAGGVPEFDPPKWSPPNSPPDHQLTPDELCRLADYLRDYPYLSSNPADPCDPTPPPVFDPTDPGSGTPPEPGDTPPPGSGSNPIPIEGGTVDPSSGGQIQLPETPPNFQDPTLPGNVNTPYQPGQTACIDNGDGSQFCAPIDRVIPSPSGPTGPTSPTLPGNPGSGFPGIPSSPIGPTIDLGPLIPSDRTLAEKKCYEGEVINAIGQALNDLGVESDRIIFDSDCTAVIPRPMCFVAGTNKRRILNVLLDMCGFCVYPQPDSNVIVGLCGPSNVHWYYHEDVDLLAWDLEYDGQEAFAYVRVFSPTYSEMVPVATPIAVAPDKIYHMEFPLGYPKTSALAAGYAKAEDIGRMALPLTGFHVPLNPLLRLRDQVHIRRPTKGYMGIYMATKLANDYDRRAYLTTGLGRWLGPDIA